MLADAHRAAAEDIERTITDLGPIGTKPYIGRSVIELYYGAAFHWLAYGCARKHAKHKENHSGLVSYLRSLGEAAAATHWENLESIRNGGWYGHKNSESEVLEAETNWQSIRVWALS